MTKTSAFSHHTSSIFPRVRQALEHEQTKKQAQQKMVEDSLTRAFDELHAGKAHRDARKLFK